MTRLMIVRGFRLNRLPGIGCALLLSLLVAAATAPAALAQQVMTKPGEEDLVRIILERALDYMDRGEFASALLEFEQVLRLDLFSVDARELAETYEQAARKLQRGERVSFSSFAETGLGYYRENTTDSTRAAGEDYEPPRDLFWLARLNTNLTYLPGGDTSATFSVDYRYRYYDADRRDDRDLRWNGALTRPRQTGSATTGLRGRLSYRGSGTYRNDFHLFHNRTVRLASDNSIQFGVDTRYRRYQSRLNERNRANANIVTAWNRADLNGRASLEVALRAGYEWRRSSSPDGNATVWGGHVDWFKDLNDRNSIFLFAWYERNGFHDGRVLYDETNAPIGEKTRSDDLAELGVGLIRRFGESWSLRPEILYIYDSSNHVWGNYSSTELWVSARLAL